jgi:hypothetical protein
MDNSSFELTPLDNSYTIPLPDDVASRWTATELIPYITFFVLLLPVFANSYSKLRAKQSFATPVWYPHFDPILGLDLLWLCAKAVCQHRLLEVSAKWALDARKTVSYLVLGKHAVLTTNPVNLKAMLSEKFHDFGLGKTRKVGLQPLFGDGIFNADGATWKVRIVVPTFDCVSSLLLEVLMTLFECRNIEVFCDLICHE